MSEKQSGREHIERTTDYLIKHGGQRPADAYEKAKETRKRVERKEQR